MSLVDQYAELLSMAQLYLLEEHSREEWVFSERQNFQYFKETAAKKPQSAAAPAPKPPAPQYASYTPQPAKPVAVKPQEPVKVAPAPVPEPVKKAVVASPVEEKKAPTHPGPFAIEQLPRAMPVDLSDIREIVRDKFPQLAILDEIPQPVVSTEVADVVIIYLNNQPEHLDFLQKVAKAIKDRFGSAEVIGPQENWDRIIHSPNLKLVMIVGTELDQTPQLKQYHREMPKLNRQLLSNVPFIPMAEISAYLTDIKQKSLLWKTVCEHLQT